MGGEAWAEYQYRAAVRELSQAQERDRDNHLKAARDHLAVCLRYRPGSTDALLLAARTARRLSAYDDAELLLKQYQDKGGVLEEVTLERALVRAQRGDVKPVEAFLTHQVDHEHPERPLILEALSYGYIRSFQMPRAFQCLAQWLFLEPGNTGAWVLRGQVNRLLSRYEESMADYRKALELDPANDEARQNLAELLIYSHRAEEANRLFEDLLTRRPGNAALTLGLARCLVELGGDERAARARQLLDQLIAEQPDNFQALSERGKIELETGDPKQAEKWLRAAVTAAHFEYEPIYNLYRCLVQLGRKDEAKALEAEFKRIEDDQKRMREVARQVMSRPTDAALRTEAGQIMLRNGQEKEGVRWLQSALQEDPAYRPAHEALAAYFEGKDAERAAFHRDRAARAEVRLPGSAAEGVR